MFPQLAHYPRHPSQQLTDPGYTTPPSEHHQTSNFPDRRGPLPFRSPRNVYPSASPSPFHNPYAVDNYNTQRIGLAASSSQGYDNPSEHMLRRKTPNGTLAAGYDGTPVRWSSKAPAQKHVLLPLSAVSSGRHYSAESTPTQDDHVGPQISNSVGWSYQPFWEEGGLHNHSETGNWTYPSLDPSNVLDHLSMQQATTYFQNGMQIPTVLQPPYQPSLGPTASNDAGLYGPYWPDGKFVPYRPAAIRWPSDIE